MLPPRSGQPLGVDALDQRLEARAQRPARGELRPGRGRHEQLDAALRQLIQTGGRLDRDTVRELARSVVAAMADAAHSHAASRRGGAERRVAPVAHQLVPELGYFPKTRSVRPVRPQAEPAEPERLSLFDPVFHGGISFERDGESEFRIDVQDEPRLPRLSGRTAEFTLERPREGIGRLVAAVERYVQYPVGDSLGFSRGQLERGERKPPAPDILGDADSRHHLEHPHEVGKPSNWPPPRRRPDRCRP